MTQTQSQPNWEAFKAAARRTYARPGFGPVARMFWHRSTDDDGVETRLCCPLTAAAIDADPTAWDIHSTLEIVHEQFGIGGTTRIGVMDGWDGRVQEYMGDDYNAGYIIGRELAEEFGLTKKEKA